MAPAKHVVMATAIVAGAAAFFALTGNGEPAKPAQVTLARAPAPKTGPCRAAHNFIGQEIGVRGLKRLYCENGPNVTMRGDLATVVGRYQTPVGCVWFTMRMVRDGDGWQLQPGVSPSGNPEPYAVTGTAETC